MSTFKKTVFLSNKENNKGMGILTLEKKNKSVFGTFKSYNLENYSDLVLGIKSASKIIKQNIISDSSNYSFILNQDIDLNESVGAVLLTCSKDSIEPIIWGSEKNENFKSQIVQNLKSNIEKIKKTETNNQTKKINKEETSETIQISEPEIEYALSPINSKETYEIHKNNYNITNFIPDKYSQISLDEEIINNEIAQVATMSDLFESSDNEIEEIIDKELINKNGAEHKFYSMIAEQLDELFDKYPKEENLEKLVDNSRWVKINTEENDKFYVVGIIYDNDDIKYICYGVPGDYYTEPPMELKGYSQWLPVDTTNPYNNGYWVMYQNADTGENVYLN